MEISGKPDEISEFILAQAIVSFSKLKTEAENLANEFIDLSQNELVKILKDYDKQIPEPVKEVLEKLLEKGHGMSNFLKDLARGNTSSS